MWFLRYGCLTPSILSKTCTRFVLFYEKFRLEARLAQDVSRLCCACRNPPAPSVESVRSALRPGEALVSLFATEEQSAFAWAIPQSRGDDSHNSPSRHPSVLVAQLRFRRALAPSAAMLSDSRCSTSPPPTKSTGILLALDCCWLAIGTQRPDRGEWTARRSALHLLVEAPALGPERGALFSRCRDIAWLIARTRSRCYRQPPRW